MAGYLYIPTQKDTMNRSDSTRSYLTATFVVQRPLTTNKKIMHLRLNEKKLINESMKHQILVKIKSLLENGPCS